LRLSIMRQLR